MVSGFDACEIGTVVSLVSVVSVVSLRGHASILVFSAISLFECDMSLLSP